MTTIIYTDGCAAPTNPGPGGAAWIIVRPRKAARRGAVGFKRTTNNRMELMAAILALQDCRDEANILVRSDSQYVVNAFEKNWLKAWQKNGWIRSDHEPVLNADLWRELLALVEGHEVRWEWLRGHAGNQLNEDCDRRASEAAARPTEEDYGYER